MVGLDNLSDPSKTVLIYKMRSNLVNSREYGTYDFGLLTWNQRAQDKQDIYLGGFCDLFATNKVFGSPFRGTVSRLYIWRNVVDIGIMGDNFLDRYFFRLSSSLGQPTCTDGVITGSNPGIVPCKMCIVGFNPPTNLAAATTLSCLSQDKSLQQMFIAFWDFNDPSSQ